MSCLAERQCHYSFEIVFCHADVIVRESRCCCNSGFVGNVTYDTFTLKRAEVLISAIALSRGHVSLIAFILRTIFQPRALSSDIAGEGFIYLFIV